MCASYYVEELHVREISCGAVSCSWAIMWRSYMCLRYHVGSFMCASYHVEEFMCASYHVEEFHVRELSCGGVSCA